MSDPTTRARLSGAVLQGLVLGVLFALTLVELVNRLGGTAAFRYQGF